MTPALALRGRLIAATGALFVGAGALHPAAWPLVALGLVVIAALCTAYVAFYPVAVFLRRHKVELAWWVPPGDQPGGALTVGAPFSLHLVLRNRGLRPLRVRDVEILASSAVDVEQALELHIPAGSEVEVTTPLRATACGHWVLHGALVRFGDALGIYELTAYFPSPIGLQVFPKLASTRAGAILFRPQSGALHERVGVHHIRRRGLAGDLREIREHAHGDPFKVIAWKPTARRRQLMVRELESEVVLTHQLLVDVAGSLRSGPPGATALDWAIETASALARIALEGGDRVGLLTFDARVVGLLRPGEGRAHLLKVVDRLIETKNPTDADLLDLGDAELVAAVARYLLHQEGVDLRVLVPPPLPDPTWARLAVGPSGELYDLAALTQLVEALLTAHGKEAERLRWRRLPGRTHSVEPTGRRGGRSAAVTERLRHFCRVRGLEVPYRSHYAPGERAAGFVDAVRRATTQERGQLVVVLSDLAGILDEPADCLRALGLARRRQHHVLVLGVQPTAFVPPAATAAGRRVAEVLARAERRRLEAARAELLRHGVPTTLVGPHDAPESLARRVARPTRAHA